MSERDQKFLDQGITHRRVPLIDGSCPLVDTKAIVGICHNLIHKGYVTVTLLNKHECIEKECPFLERFENYPFWIRYTAREKQKANIKKAKKKRLKIEQEQKEKAARETDNLRELAHTLVDRLGYSIVITRIAYNVDSQNPYDFIIYYVSEKSKNDWYEYIDLAVVMGSCYGGRYLLRHVKLPNGNYATVSDWKKRKS